MKTITAIDNAYARALESNENLNLKDLGINPTFY